jgi:hypothetical protein
MFGNKKAKAENLMANGARGVGTITDVRDTGMTINDNPRVKVAFRVEPLDGGAAFEVTKTKTVSRVRIPQSGTRYPIFYDAQDPQTFAWVEVGDDQGRASIVQMFGDAFGADGSGVGQPAMAAPAAAAAAPTEDDLALKIQKLDLLKAQGLVNDSEYAEQKARILAEL